MRANQVKRLATENGVTERTLRRAKAAMGVKSKRTGFGPSSEFFWSLPKEHEMVKELRDRDMENLMDALIDGEPSDRVPNSNDRTCPPSSAPPNRKMNHEGGGPTDPTERSNSSDSDDDDLDGLAPTAS